MESENKKKKPSIVSIYNIRKKIKKNFSKFLINFFNSVIGKHYSYSDKLQKINYTWTSNIKADHIKDLYSQKIQTVFSNDNVAKSNDISPHHNKQLIEKVIQHSVFLNELFQKTFGEIYFDLYLNGDIEQMKEQYGEMSKVSLFRDMYNTVHKLDNEKKEKYKDKMLDIAMKFFQFRENR